MDRHKTPLVMMRVEQGEFLMTVHHIDRIVDVERHRVGWPGVAVAPRIDQGIGQADDLAQSRGVLPTRDRGLRAQIPPRIGQSPAGNGQHADAQNIGQTDPPLGGSQQQAPPSEVIRPPSKSAVIFLRRMAGNRNGWLDVECLKFEPSGTDWNHEQLKNKANCNCSANILILMKT